MTDDYYAKNRDQIRQKYKDRWEQDPEYRKRMKHKAAELQRAKISHIRAHKATAGCALCGESDPIVLELHHRDPNEKNPSLKHTPERRATSIYQLSWAKINEELGKCDVLCANCHRRETWKARVARGESTAS